MQKRKAFTLIELSVVLIVIMLLVTGIVKGGALTQASRMAGARAITAKSVVPHVNGLLAWYEASTQDSFTESETFDETQLTTWNDIGPSISVNQSNALTKSASSDVTYVEDGIHGIPSVYFDGSSTSSNITLTSFYQGSFGLNSIFIVFSPLGTLASAQTILDSDSSGNSYVIEVSSASVAINAGGTDVSLAASVTTGETYILAANFNGTNSSVFLNGTESADVDDVGSNALKGLTIGSNKSGTERFEGTISEIIIYNRPLKIQERRDIFRYLSDKYNVTVAGI